MKVLFKIEVIIMVLEPSPLPPSSFELEYGTIFSHQHSVCRVPGDFLFT